ncbi:MAG: TIGR00730 family Rossman fold protein [Eubacteriales bacterium]
MRICVYGASSDDIDAVYIKTAEELGEKMAKRGHSLVFGGGATGLMGGAARGILKAGGELVGIAPKFFDVPGVLCKSCTEFIFTETMRERKQLMEDMSDAFVVVPGGIGTYEEFFEMLTLKQLGRHKKAIAVLNTGGYYDTVGDLMKKTVEKGFMKPECLGLYSSFDSVDGLLDFIERYDLLSVNTDGLKNI